MALFAEALLVLLILTLGSSLGPRESKDAAVPVVRFKAAAHREQAPDRQDEKEPSIRPAEDSSTREIEPKEEEEEEEEEVPLPKARQEATSPQVIRLSSQEMAAMDIAKLPRQPGPSSEANQPRMGPADTGARTGDTPRVSGSGPNGEPLYAASWYREPYDEELRGYLSTASGPGWGLIACRTAPDYRVEDCVKVDEYPTGSNIARAVLAAAWQFRVRPPRIGGEPKIGEWVRIRIDYEFRSEARR